MTKMVSLKMTETEAKSDYGLGTPMTPSETRKNLPRYPYDTKLRLTTDTLKKLGIDVGDYPSGTRCTITAQAEVTSTELRESQAGGERAEICLQITDIAIEPTKGQKKEKARDKHLDRISGAGNKAEEY